jgi:homoserine kinase type II
MSVFTSVSSGELRPFLASRQLGPLLELQGIAAGITNTNYFVTTGSGRFVLTLFETLKADELPFYVGLMAHLAKHGVALAAPIARADGAYVETLCGKPALIVPCLPGRVADDPSAAQCAAVGAMLARLHLAGADFPDRMVNPRGPHWWWQAAEKVYAHMPAESAGLLRGELTWQKKHRQADLPSGVVHADLFRDNVLMNGDEVGGFIDFYYACNDVLLYDLAIAVNDWCVLPDGDLDAARARAMLAGYQTVRALSEAEVLEWPTLLRAAALRFWTSRLVDFYYPAPGELTFAKDPTHFERVIRYHAQRKDFWL